MTFRARAVIFSGLLLTAPSLAIVSVGAAPAATSKPVSSTMKGVVKSVGAGSLVVTINKKAQETFVLNSSTTREGTLASGSTVDVTYYMDNGHRVATAVTVKDAKGSTAKAGN